MKVNVLIQARMSSNRYPGKVLAPINNIPLIKCVIDQVKKVKNLKEVIVLTSTEKSDDPLVGYLKEINVDVYRGSLENVFDRFQKALKSFPCDYFVRICADSPFISSNLIEYMVAKCSDKLDFDMITNIYKRTFPKGQSVEIINTSSFLRVESTSLDRNQQEHVTPCFYDHKFKILSVTQQKNQSNDNMCVDTVDDLKRLTILSDNFVLNKSSINFEKVNV